jgi:branched-subunit amino acid transport protein
LKEWWILFGMAGVTYAARALPAWLMSRLHLPPAVTDWLAQVPYAALGALIFPGILNASPGHPFLSLAAGGVATWGAWRGLAVHWVLLAAVAVVLLGTWSS